MGMPSGSGAHGRFRHRLQARPPRQRLRSILSRFGFLGVAEPGGPTFTAGNRTRSISVVGRAPSASGSPPQCLGGTAERERLADYLLREDIGIYPAHRSSEGTVDPAKRQVEPPDQGVLPVVGSHFLHTHPPSAALRQPRPKKSLIASTSFGTRSARCSL